MCVPEAWPVSPKGYNPYHKAMRQPWHDYRVFWRQFRDAYHTTGAVLPSGRALAAALSRFVQDGECVADSLRSKIRRGEESDQNQSGGRSRGRRILEVGPGTGAVTAQIVRYISANDTLDLVERNEQFVAHLRERIAGEPTFQAAAKRITLIYAAVEELPEDRPYDLIISGLPLNNFAVEVVEQILAKLARLLKPGGTLSFFEYVAIRRAKSLVSRQAERQRLRAIGQMFDEMLRKREMRRDLVLANVPPAWVHHVRFR